MKVLNEEFWSLFLISSTINFTIIVWGWRCCRTFHKQEDSRTFCNMSHVEHFAGKFVLIIIMQELKKYESSTSSVHKLLRVSILFCILQTIYRL